MIWQDAVISGSSALFGYSLIYQVFRGFKDRKGYIAFQTSFFTIIGLYAMSLAFFTLNLITSGVISTLNGTLWLVLLIQRCVYTKA